MGVSALSICVIGSLPSPPHERRRRRRFHFLGNTIRFDDSGNFPFFSKIKSVPCVRVYQSSACPPDSDYFGPANCQFLFLYFFRMLVCGKKPCHFTLTQVLINPPSPSEPRGTVVASKNSRSIHHSFHFPTNHYTTLELRHLFLFFCCVTPPTYLGSSDGVGGKGRKEERGGERRYYDGFDANWDF